MRDIPFQRSMYHASADFAHRRMTHRSLGACAPKRFSAQRRRWAGFLGTTACREAPCKKRTEVSYFPGFIRKGKEGGCLNEISGVLLQESNRDGGRGSEGQLTPVPLLPPNG